MCITGAAATWLCGTTGRRCIGVDLGLRMRRALWCVQRYLLPRRMVLKPCAPHHNKRRNDGCAVSRAVQVTRGRRSTAFEIRDTPLGHRVHALLEILRLAQAGLLLKFVVG